MRTPRHRHSPILYQDLVPWPFNCQVQNNKEFYVNITHSLVSKVYPQTRQTSTPSSHSWNCQRYLHLLNVVKMCFYLHHPLLCPNIYSHGYRANGQAVVSGHFGSMVTVSAMGSAPTIDTGVLSSTSAIKLGSRTKLLWYWWTYDGWLWWIGY